MIAGAAEMAVVGRAFLLAMGRANGAVHVEHDDLQRFRACTRSIQTPGRAVSAARLSIVSNSVSNRPIWLVDAPPRSTLAADDPPHRGISARAGRRRSPRIRRAVQRRPKQTDDTVPTVLAGPAARTSLASTVRPRASVEFAVGAGCDPRTVQLQLQPSVETGPKWAAIRFTLRVPHPSHLHLIYSR